MKDPVPSLAQAPQSVQLAVDLIYLLETNHIDPEIALEALRIVEQDLQGKLNQTTDAGAVDL
jgi:hypothetical protein